VDVFIEPGSSDLLAALRRATRARHERLDAAIAGAFTRDRYVAFLRASLSAIDAIEPALERWRPAGAAPSRERLRADLTALGAPVPPPAAAEVFADADAALGAAYVLEGSALGGQVLARQVVAALGEVPTSYLAPQGGPATGARWKQFLGTLERRGAATPASAHARACDAACATFDRFADAFAAAGLFTDEH
jgi:heme oxygenase (biliverdin-IX-beta and delta-forming)